MNVLLADPDKKFVNEVLSNWALEDSPLAAVTEEADLISWAKEETVGLCFICAAFLVLKDLDAISFLKEHHPGIEIVVLCDSKTVQVAENALVRGAASYLLKPVDAAVLENTARKVQQRSSNRKNYRLMEDHVLEDLLGNTPEMRKILRLVHKVAPTNSTILITGESGTGKEFIANAIHRLSKRSDEPFVAVNCGAIPENIVESELFGSRKGAFTGAIANKKGLFEEADGGTLFLDEVAELSPATQVKLLRFLQNKEIRRVGETETRFIDVRILAATNRDVTQAIKDGTFREDLYYRLNTFHIAMPPLRMRRDTIPKLVKFFLLKYQQENQKVISRIHPVAQLALASYSYPGNIRELQNIIEHAAVLAEDEEISLDDLPEVLRPKATQNYLTADLAEAQTSPVQMPEGSPFPAPTQIPSLLEGDEVLSLEEVERRHILHALRVLGNNQTEVAKRLGISRSTLWRKLQDHQIKLD
ncbi:MAG TPA: sigma-54 dependent transcriptional regulator [Fibrobacteraceae bacterium]|nr:sigma-54 dependent transcriptional regulator [Fibrobacteraceae bacterium]